MKSFNNKILLAVLGLTALSSCYKKFDADSYKPALSIGGYSSSKDVGAANLVGYWSFDGSLVDSVSKTAGTNTGTSFVNGVKGKAMQGADQSYVLFNPPTALQNLQSFSVAMWVNSPQNTSGIVGLIDIANTASFWGNLTVFFENGSTADKAVLKIHVNNNGKDAWLGNYEVQNIWNVWTHIAATYDAASSTFKVFVNGARIAEKTEANFGPLVFNNATKMVFGTVQFQTTPSLTSATANQSWASYLKGGLDEVRIYNKALSEGDINALVRLEGRGK